MLDQPQLSNSEIIHSKSNLSNDQELMLSHNSIDADDSCYKNNTAKTEFNKLDEKDDDDYKNLAAKKETNDDDSDSDSSGNSITTLMKKDKPFLIKLILFSSFAIVIVSIISIYFSIKNNLFCLIDITYLKIKMKNSTIIENYKEIFAYLSLIFLNFPSLLISIDNIFIIREMFTNKNFKNIFNGITNYYFPILNIFYSISLLFGFFINRNETNYKIIYPLFDLISLFCIIKYYFKIKKKSQLSSKSFILVSNYTSLLFAIFSYSLFFNISQFFINYDSEFIKSNIMKRYLIINIIQILIGIMLITYYNDMIYLFSIISFIFLPELFFGIYFKAAVKTLLFIIINGVFIIGWKIYKNGIKFWIFGRRKYEEEDENINYVKMRNLSND